VVEEGGGRLVELRGDEALAVFGSVRQALRTAVGLQQRFGEATREDLPLRVGIGIDSGEAVAVGEGFRGGALNLAARLCSVAGPGEILTSEGVVHLARHVEGLAYRERTKLRLKGLEAPVRAFEVVVEAPPEPRRVVLLRRLRLALGSAKQELLASPRRRGLAAAALLCLIALAVVLSLELTRSAQALARVNADSAAVLDGTGKRLAKELAVGAGPGRLAYGAGSVWVSNTLGGTVSRVDPRHVTAEPIRVGPDPAGIAFGSGAVWVTTSQGRKLLRINPKSNSVVQEIPVGNGAGGVAVADNKVWVANRFDDTVSEVDALTGKPLKTFGAGSAPTAVAVGFGSVWIADGSTATLTRLDPSSGTQQAILVGNGPSGVAVGNGSVWVANSLDGTVSRVDPSTDRVTNTFSVGEGPSDLSAGAGNVWVANTFGNTLSRIDAGQNRVVDEVPVGNGPGGVAVTPAGVWLTSRAGSAGHRGGTLRVASTSFEVDSLDPATAYSPQTWALVTALHDGLLTFKRTSGLDGGSLVPDLATSVPAPTDGGRAYTFHLRSGVRYSTGELVRASDIRRAVERGIRLKSPGAQYFAGIAGAAACARRPAACDLSHGIVADDGQRTVTIRLTSPDPDFLYKLALPFFSAVPDARVKGLPPATGPYMVRRYVPGRTILLTRNPAFRQWSAAAQPDGFADRILITLRGSPAQRLAWVERGQSDLDASPPAQALAQLAARFTTQLHVFPGRATNELFVNMRVAPFDDVRARQALNYALDRATSLSAGGFATATPTCQVLPPNFPGYEPYCPYTLNPRLGSWSAPNLEKARALVRASGTRGSRVTLWYPSASPLPGSAPPATVMAALRQMGYRPSLHVIKGLSDYFAKVYDSRTRAQVGFSGWLADFAAGSGYLTPQVSCQSFKPGSALQNQNASEFCDPSVDARIRRALRLQAADPSASGPAWAAIDRAVVDRAALVPINNPRDLEFTSRRVGNYQFNPQWGVLLDQLWVR
jgi:YVTN family beta-propeller protein